MKHFFDKIAPSLEEIELGRIFPFTNIAYQEIFKKCHKLQILDIYIRHAPQTSKFYRKLTPSHSLKELFIRDYEEIHEKALKGLIGNAPNLETLNIRGDGISKDLLHFISINLPKLKQLFADLPSGSMADIKLSSLTTIVVGNSFILDEDWTEICNAMPNINTFVFDDNTDRDCKLEEITIKAVTENWKKLEVVHFFSVQLSDVEYILKNCANIKSVITCEFPDDQEVSAAIQAIKKNGRRLVRRVLHQKSLYFQYHESLWENLSGFIDTGVNLYDGKAEKIEKETVQQLVQVAQMLNAHINIQEVIVENVAGWNIAGEVHEAGQEDNNAEEIEQDDNVEAESSEDDEEEFYLAIDAHKAQIAALL